MSRSGYIEDFEDNWSLIKWRGQVASAARGKRGRKLLEDLLRALDAMEEKALITDALVEYDGRVCALGAAGKARGLKMEELDSDDTASVACAFDIAEPLAREIVYENDEGGAYNESPERRWARMRAWVESVLTTGKV